MTPQQREHATTIYERSIEGRRAATLPPTGVEETPLIDRLTLHAEALGFTAPDGSRIRVTSSFGVASFPLVTGQSQLVAAADAALYEAKRSGKDRVVVSDGAAVSSHA